MLSPRRVFLLLLCLLGSLPALSAPRYRVVEGYQLRAAYSLNNLGVLAGVTVDASRVYPAIGTNTMVQTLPALMAGGEGRALAVNDRNQVAGNAMTPAPPPFTGIVSHAMYWSAETGTVDLTPNITGASFAYNISNAGLIVGERMEGDTSGPFVWRVGAGGAVEERRIGKAESTTNSANDVNENGMVAGTHFNYAWVYDYSTDVVTPLPQSERGSAYGINDRNEVAGFYRDPGFVRRTALWRRSGGDWALTDVGVLPDPHGSCSGIEINNRGTMIGECIGPSGVATKPFLWEGGPLVPIDELLVAEDASRWRVTAVYDINESGRIVAAARLNEAPAVLVTLEPVERRRPLRR